MTKRPGPFWAESTRTSLPSNVHGLRLQIPRVNPNSPDLYPFEFRSKGFSIAGRAYAKRSLITETGLRAGKFPKFDRRAPNPSLSLFESDFRIIPKKTARTGFFHCVSRKIRDKP
jgi:hypothetical protein